MPSLGCEGVGMEPIAVYDLETRSDEVACRLKHLLELNHRDYSILYNNHRFHNHSPHFLGCAYLFGGSTKYLDSIYNDLVIRDNLESWKQSPGRIDLENYRAHLSKGEYQRAWVDFFEEQFRTIEHDHDWRKVAAKFLFDADYSSEITSTPMFHCLGVDLGHPLIHLGYAYELNSPEIAAEALGLTATCYDAQFASLLTKSNTSPMSSKPMLDLFEVFKRVYEDESLPNFPNPGDENIELILDNESHREILLMHFNSWSIVNPTSQFSQAHHLAALVLIATSSRLGGHGYDFFLVHVLTTAHAVRVLLPILPAEHHVTLLRQWLLVALLAYVAQGRPKLDTSFVEDFQLRDRDWEYVRKQAMEGEFSTDAHFIKACRAMHIAAETWNDEENWFLKCAVRFVSEFEGWCGFNTEVADAELVRMHRIKDGIRVK